MGLLDFFGKKKAVKVDYNLAELNVGFIVEYFMKTWEVKKVYHYDWGNNFDSIEYLLDAGDEKCYLSVEDDDGIVCMISKKVEMSAIDANLVAQIVKQDDAPQQLVYENKTYHRKSSGQGYCGENDDSKENWSKFVNWVYESGEEFISIDRWAEEEFSAVQGSYVKEFEFSNILPK